MFKFKHMSKIKYMPMHIYVYVYVCVNHTACVIPVVRKEFICSDMWFICPYPNTEKSLLLSV